MNELKILGRFYSKTVCVDVTWIYDLNYLNSTEDWILSIQRKDWSWSTIAERMQNKAPKRGSVFTSLKEREFGSIIGFCLISMKICIYPRAHLKTIPKHLCVRLLSARVAGTHQIQINAKWKCHFFLATKRIPELDVCHLKVEVQNYLLPVL